MADTAPASAPLDDIMLAMDVVDTLRHREHLVARELNEDAREADLLARLRDIYRAQGIAVSDEILLQGVEALKENRFVYTPPAPGLNVKLARLYVRRRRYGRIALIALAALALVWGGWLVGYKWPAERAAQALRIEMTETLPGRIVDLGNEIARIAEVPEAREKAVAIMAEGDRALRENDAEAARRAVGELAVLRDELAREYTITIVSRPGELSGVWRVPDANPQAQNFYLIVEALGEDSVPLAIAVRNEETGAVRRVAKWGVRVSEEVFARVRADKLDDGIIQDKTVGTKPRGHLEPEYAMPVLGGMITEW